jgi:hypothetical protein
MSSNYFADNAEIIETDRQENPFGIEDGLRDDYPITPFAYAR